MSRYEIIRQMVGRKTVRKYAQPVFFAGGFAYDSLTLTRIDRLADNVILMSYLFFLGLFIVLIGRIEQNSISSPRVLRYRHIYPLLIQFFFGSLFSAYVVFYIYSASWTKTAIFVALLFSLLVANEFLQNRLDKLPVLLALFYFSTASFVTFFLPVVTGLIAPWLFYMGAVLSLFLAIGLLCLIFGWRLWQGQKDRVLCLTGVVGTCALFILLYALNWIPPVPLSLKFGGIYHSVRKEGSGYHLTYVPSPWHSLWKTSEDPFYYRPGDRAYCFTSVFAPSNISMPIVHVWHRYDEKKKIWREESRISYPISGGREGGYRGYTYKQAVMPGHWRVHVEIPDGRTLGYVGFEIMPAKQDSLAFVTVVR